ATGKCCEWILEQYDELTPSACTCYRFFGVLSSYLLKVGCVSARGGPDVVSAVPTIRSGRHFHDSWKPHPSDDLVRQTVFATQSNAVFVPARVKEHWEQAMGAVSRKNPG